VWVTVILNSGKIGFILGEWLSGGYAFFSTGVWGL